jgi:hypothetical protein
MTTISLRLPGRLARRLEARARERNITRSALVRECLERVLVDGRGSHAESFHDLAKDLCGTFPGPRDLASNPKHLEVFSQRLTASLRTKFVRKRRGS